MGANPPNKVLAIQVQWFTNASPSEELVLGARVFHIRKESVPVITFLNSRKITDVSKPPRKLR
jgi:hypothetical protein